MKLPGYYSRMSWQERRQAREQYRTQQKGLCYHCKGSLDEGPPKEVTSKTINWKLFPPNFLQYPHHLHHNHDTDLTIGVVHSYCNAVLWQYHGE